MGTAHRKVSTSAADWAIWMPVSSRSRGRIRTIGMKNRPCRATERKVAVPVRLEQKTIGEAMLLAARVRPKFIGGERAYYDDRLKDGYPEE